MQLSNGDRPICIAIGTTDPRVLSCQLSLKAIAVTFKKCILEDGTSQSFLILIFHSICVRDMLGLDGVLKGAEV